MHGTRSPPSTGSDASLTRTSLRLTQISVLVPFKLPRKLCVSVFSLISCFYFSFPFDSNIFSKKICTETQYWTCCLSDIFFATCIPSSLVSRIKQTVRQLWWRSWIYNDKNIGQITSYVLCLLTVCDWYWLTDKGQVLWSFAVLLNWQICNSPQTDNTVRSAANDSFMDQLTTYLTFLIGLLDDFLFNFLNFSQNVFFMLRFWIFCYRREGTHLLMKHKRIQVFIDNIKPAYTCSK